MILTVRPGSVPGPVVPRRSLSAAVGCLAWLLFPSASFAAVTLEAAQQLLLGGDYAAVITVSDEAMRGNPADSEWPLLRAAALTQVGRYSEARDTLNRAV